MNFELSMSKKRTTDLGIVFYLIKNTNNSDINWEITYDNDYVVKFVAILNINDTKKRIKINYYYNKEKEYDSILNIVFLNKKNGSGSVIRSLRGSVLVPLFDTIKKQFENDQR